MKKWVLYYLIISLLFGAIIYLITLFQITQEQTNEAFIQLTKDVSDNKDIDAFSRYSTRGYESIKRVETEEYVIEIIQSLGLSEGEDLHQLVIFVIPQNKMNITFAKDVNDPQDQSQLIIVSQTLNMNSKEEASLSEYALSVGIHTLGFYYYAFPITDDIEGTLSLFDYEGDVIITEQLQLTYMFEEDTFIGSMTEDEIQALINVDDILNQTLLTRLLIFAVIDICIAIIISIFLRRKV